MSKTLFFIFFLLLLLLLFVMFFCFFLLLLFFVVVVFISRKGNQSDTDTDAWTRASQNLQSLFSFSQPG